MVAKVCFITAIYGAYKSQCLKYAHQTITTDFICFTDDVNITSNGWIIDSTPYHLENKCPFDDGTYLNLCVSVTYQRHGGWCARVDSVYVT